MHAVRYNFTRFWSQYSQPTNLDRNLLVR
jgi:hypothetical protein